VLFGHSEGGSLAAFFAATHPERVLALVLYNAAARIAWAPDYPLGLSREPLREGGDVQLDPRPFAQC
jgi:pimeloyl-ACP methyl ester carboxylesterase